MKALQTTAADRDFHRQLLHLEASPTAPWALGLGGFAAKPIVDSDSVPHRQAGKVRPAATRRGR
ncbi:hypothetical protein [Rosistilla oblonga]|uniref:hypothetical protein n=1 Tax=Rosistilla oblonga TaxID=2527990 RepID=UPI003A978E3C